ncbi:flagellar basal body-associated FliL family protein [Thermosulfurimonas marina]|uniref:Flagellar protein FliL n=1 Tax=Thermosulfurimonas marina TaxID=2047767 RepID=A0A6H1WU19_9BACT|nr:flagellar basal body-associated FliL family protein [Thermosulfurimonas marina]QJA06703.1 flagellar basal body-associated FliL family protein [Thermosulfurimonas marina]
MNRYLKTFLLLFLVSAVLLLILKWTAVKNFLVNLRQPSGESPSMIRALPFDVLKERSSRKALEDLRKRLTPTQILIEDIVASPRGAPPGRYVRVSVVVEAPDMDSAHYLEAHRGKLATLILDTLQSFPYEELKRRDGVKLFKEALVQKIEFFYGPQVKEVSLVEFEFRRAGR